MSSKRSIAELATEADTAAKTGTAIAQFTHTQDLTVAEAYEVQEQAFAKRLERGETIVGIKMGLTSKAKMEQVGVDEVIWGRLSDAMRVDNAGNVTLEGYVHPRVEPEIAFQIGQALSGDVTAEEAMAAVSGVAPAAEIIDSRFENFSFALADVVADNSSSSGFVVGDWVDPKTSLRGLGMTLSCDGEVAESGTSDAILGDPVQSLVEAARMAGRAGMVLQPGWIVLAGAATAAKPLAAGSSYEVTVENLGSVGFAVDA